MTLMNSNTERIACLIAGMNRGEVKKEILHFQGNFKLDFPEHYLDKMPVERLRHILLAAKLQQGDMN